jgi:HAD superfamily hydrolase (TIGR01509 family)
VNPARYDLVVFDCDGVLVDSERITARVFAAMLVELGLDVSALDIFDRFVGKSMDQCLVIITDLLGRSVPEDFVANYRARSTAALLVEVKPVAGIEAALAAIRIPYCVASNGLHDKMRATLGITGLLPSFAGRMFSVSDVARGKPFPDLFLHAAAHYGAMPSRCAVVEDTPTGVTAGVAAGMTVYGYCALTPRRRLIEAGARYTFDRMEELPDLLQGT